MSFPSKAGGSASARGLAITSLSDGSSIITGRFDGTSRFGDITLTSAGVSDAFIAKLNRDGSYAWVTQAGGTGNDYGQGISSLANGSSIVTGLFADNASFGDFTITSAGSIDVFIAKLNADGSFAWVAQSEGPNQELGNGISTLSDGSSIITGYFFGAATFGGTTLTNAGNTDVFITKLNQDGSFAWATQAGGTGLDFGEAITTQRDGSSVVIGEFQGTARFGETTLTSAGNPDVFIAKLNADGSYAWAKRAGGNGNDFGEGISSLPDGSSIVTGYFHGTATFGNITLTSSGSSDVFIAKLNADGSYAWATQAGGINFDEGQDISSQPDGSSIITGEFEGQATFGDTTLNSTGPTASFIAKLNADGSFAWATQAGGAGHSDGQGISSLPDGSSIVTGFFDGSAAFGETTLSSSGGFDIFTAALDANGNWLSVIPFQSINQNRTQPTFLSAATNTAGNKVILTFNERLSKRNIAAASDFEVTTAGSTNLVTEVEVSGRTIELTLATPVSNNQSVTVTYTQPNTFGTGIKSLQNNSRAASLSSAAVSNNSTLDANSFIDSDDPLGLSIAQLFQAAFSRLPDQEGYDYWRELINDPLIDYKDIASSFCTSAEFAAIAPPGSSNSEFVQILYQHSLDRAADSTGLIHWTKLLDNDLQDRADLLMEFANSQENAALLNSLPA